MMSSTHAISALLGASLLLGTADPTVLSAAAIAALLPDIDTSRSVVGRLLLPISRAIEKRFPHRTITHSLLASLAIAIASIPVVFLFGRIYYLAINLGYFLGWYFDNFTKEGVCAFFPSNVRLVTPLNYRLRVRVGTVPEYAIALLLLLGFLFFYNINTNGGIMRQVNLLMQQPDAAVKMYRESGNNFKIMTEVIGRYRVSNREINKERFQLIYPLGSDLILKKSNGDRFLAGEGDNAHILIHRVRPWTSTPVQLETLELSLEDEPIAEVIAKIPPSREVYISGRIILDDELVLPPSEQYLEPVTVEGKAAVIEAAEPEEVLTAIGEYYGTGQLLVRLID